MRAWIQKHSIRFAVFIITACGLAGAAIAESSNVGTGLLTVQFYQGFAAGATGGFAFATSLLVVVYKKKADAYDALMEEHAMARLSDKVA